MHFIGGHDGDGARLTLLAKNIEIGNICAGPIGPKVQNKLAFVTTTTMNPTEKAAHAFHKLVNEPLVGTYRVVGVHIPYYRWSFMSFCQGFLATAFAAFGIVGIIALITDIPNIHRFWWIMLMFTIIVGLALLLEAIAVWRYWMYYADKMTHHHNRAIFTAFWSSIAIGAIIMGLSWDWLLTYPADTTFNSSAVIDPDLPPSTRALVTYLNLQTIIVTLSFIGSYLLAYATACHWHPESWLAGRKATHAEQADHLHMTGGGVGVGIGPVSVGATVGAGKRGHRGGQRNYYP